MQTYIVKKAITRERLEEIAKEIFGDMVKAVVDVEKKIVGLSAELHMDIATLLIEKENSELGNLWGINLYPSDFAEDFIEFDSMVNIKPAVGNRTRGINDDAIKKKIRSIVGNLIE